MSRSEYISLRNRTFNVTHAKITLQGDLWSVEIETEFEEFDGERWAPYLYHQGLRIAATNPHELEGKSTSWHLSSGQEYPHPELGIMYVFGHHDVRDCTLTFGNYAEDRIEIEWSGTCDVFWDVEFQDKVPFQCKCFASVSS